MLFRLSDGRELCTNANRMGKNNGNEYTVMGKERCTVNLSTWLRVAFVLIIPRLGSLPRANGLACAFHGGHEAGDTRPPFPPNQSLDVASSDVETRYVGDRLMNPAASLVAFLHLFQSQLSQGTCVAGWELD
jgi:hypothetical protein